jgi:hypothetical protein
MNSAEGYCEKAEKEREPKNHILVPECPPDCTHRRFYENRGLLEASRVDLSWGFAAPNVSQISFGKIMRLTYIDSTNTGE